MKRYKDYMDAVEVSDTLHEKLKHLEEPRKRPRPWKGLAVMALIIGAGAWGLSRGGWNGLMDNFHPTGDWNDLIDHFDPAIEAAPEIPHPDIAYEDPNGEFTVPPSGGGYEIVEGGLAVYYVLPWLNWVDVSTQPQAALDYQLAPPSAIHRDASLEDALILTGDINGDKPGHNWANHLQWHHMDWGGTLWFLEDGTPQAAALYADESGLHLSLEVMKGGEVPSCIVLPDESYETSRWQGVEITALKNGGYAVIDGVELREKREVSFFCDGVGYKLTLYADDAARADELCARFVRYAVDGGFHLDALSIDEFVPSYDPSYEDGIPDKGIPPEDMPTANILHPGDEGYIEPFPAPGSVPDEDSDCPYCADGSAHTHAYDPSARG